MHLIAHVGGEYSYRRFGPHPKRGTPWNARQHLSFATDAAWPGLAHFFLADVQTGVGPFLAIYLAGYRWDEERVGLALTVAGIAGTVCVVTTQVVITLIASWSGREAGTWGRKPLLLIAFGVLPGRGLLCALTSNTALHVAIQILDGIGAGIFGVVSVLVIADLTRGTGRFNLTLGAITTAVGIGASLSQVIAGGIVHQMGFRAGFLFLAGVASAALAVLYLFMPETRNTWLEKA